MEPTTENKLKIWKVFRDVGPDGEEILKTAKLAHVVDAKYALVVTMTDETYFFFPDGDGGCKIGRIPNLCGVRVREFVVAITRDCLAITEDGSLYSFRIWDLPKINVPPRLVRGSLRGKKVQQVALAGWRGMALTEGGHVHHWLPNKTSKTKPILISKKNFDHQEVISIACSDHISVALTSNGELFQWELDNKMPQKVIVATKTPLKKIVALSHIICALTVDGAMYSGRFHDYPESKPIWTVVTKHGKFQDITTSGTDHVVVGELKDNSLVALSYRGGIVDPHVLSISSPNGTTSLDELFAEISQTTWRTIRVQRDLVNLWVNKDNVDVTFFVEWKTISAHKFILTSRSEYFAKMFSNSGNEMKSEFDCIEIKDTKFEIFEALLFYIYHDKISFSGDEYENIFGLMQLADAHCSVKIRHECEQILMGNITAENAVFLVRNAGSANASDLERNVIQFILDKRLLDVYSSPQELTELLGMEAFQKISMVAIHRA